MEENKQSDIKIEKVEKTQEVKESSDSLVISQKGKNTRNIPAVLFIEKVEEYYEKFGERIYEEMNMLYNKYKYMEGQIVKHTDTIRLKLPDLKKGLETVDFLKTQVTKNVKVDYMISNNLWAKADVPVTDRVCLWLGADVLCEYTLDEAKSVLNKNYEAALTALKNNEDDLDFLKDQITTCEVNIARLHNENVKRKNVQQK